MQVTERMDFALSLSASLPDNDDSPLGQILSDIVDDCIDELMTMYEAEQGGE